TLVDRKVVLLEIVQCPRRQLVAERRHLRQPEPLQDVRVPVVEVAGEETITLDQLLSDLVHLRGLVLRPADEQYPWLRLSQMCVRAAIVSPPCERLATTRCQPWIFRRLGTLRLSKPAYNLTPMTSPFDLSGRAIIVTGGAGLLGREYGRALAAAG